VIFANGHELPETTASVAESWEVGSLCRLLTEILLHHVIAVDSVTGCPLEIKVRRALIQGDVGETADWQRESV
jgi:hypothetical protein